MSVLQTVKGCSLFHELYDKEIMDIVQYCRVLNLERGDYIFKDGETGNEVFLILSGSASVKKGPHTIANLRKGDLFGEMVLLKENIRKADIVADTYTDVLLIDYDDLFNYFQRDTKIFSILMLNLARMLATRLNNAGEQIRDLSIENSELKKDKKAA
jgi:CRP/FNR family cyclic AMP-dependent transcriptional regulator